MKKKRTGRASDRAMRPPMRLPGRPPVSLRANQQLFWQAVRCGLSTEEAAAAASVSAPVGHRWFRGGGGMSVVSRHELSGRYLSFDEREEIALLTAQGHGIREIARRMNRAPSTISRETRRNASTRSGAFIYRATIAQWHADRRAKRPKEAKLACHEHLRQYVQRRLAGALQAPSRTIVHGPKTR